MGAKGTVDTKIDTGALNEIIVFANMYKTEVSSLAEEIRTICRKMDEEESLKGGDGDGIRDSFDTIATGCQQIAKSAEQIAKILDTKLSKALNMKNGAMSANASESASAAAKKAGVVRKE